MEAWAYSLTGRNSLEHWWVTSNFNRRYARSHCGQIVAKKGLVEVSLEVKRCKICKKAIGASEITSLQSQLEAANADAQVARGQYQGACDIIKQLEQQIADLTAQLEGGGEPVGTLSVHSQGRCIGIGKIPELPIGDYPVFLSPPTASAAVAAAEARELKLREALKYCHEHFPADNIVNSALALPGDKSSLEEYRKKVLMEAADELFKAGITDEGILFRMAEEAANSP